MTRITECDCFNTGPVPKKRRGVQLLETGFPMNRIRILFAFAVALPLSTLITPRAEASKGRLADIYLPDAPAAGVSDPAAVRQGHDPQFEKTVAVLLAELEKYPIPAAQKPPYPKYQIGQPRK